MKERSTLSLLAALLLSACGGAEPPPAASAESRAPESANTQVGPSSDAPAGASTPQNSNAGPETSTGTSVKTPQATPAQPEPPKPPPEKDQYHVYRLSSTACEVDMRNHKRFTDDRGSGSTCMGHFDYRMDADKLRDKLIKEKACKK